MLLARAYLCICIIYWYCIRGPPDESLLVDIASSLEPWAQKAFAGTKRLNTIQSKVFPVAYHSFENMLVMNFPISCLKWDFWSAV